MMASANTPRDLKDLDMPTDSACHRGSLDEGQKDCDDGASPSADYMGHCETVCYCAFLLRKLDRTEINRT